MRKIIVIANARLKEAFLIKVSLSLKHTEKYFSNSVDYQTIAIIDENLSSEGNTMDLTPFVF